MGSFLFINLAIYVCLMFTLVMEGEKAFAWISGSVLSLLLGWMLISPFEAVVASAKAEVVDGLMLGSALDPGRTPTACAMMFERIGDLTGDRDADDATFAELMTRDPVAPEGSVPEALREHLVRDVGPAQLALGGDLLLRMPLTRSMARGQAYR